MDELHRAIGQLMERIGGPLKFPAIAATDHGYCISDSGRRQRCT